ncbi:MAG: molybdate ABC transporter substrate-binding protein [Acidimicrobiia bacterium]|nr:molybdate ABC transporter substrate-binding protein [Acidimicrobiia bacterium]NNL70551.1 molybdate ABC transporter substrate-binding protein [Acidimicrobiia bacterium]
MTRFLMPILGVILAACSSGTDTLTVGAASSLTEVMDAVGDAFEGSGVIVSAAGSQVVAAQVREGAPLDVVVTADEATIDRLAAGGLLAGEPVRIAGNRLVIVVAAGNPKGVAGLADLVREDVTVVLAASQVPAGAYAAETLAAAGIVVSPASLEPSVRAVVAKVRLGEADAGLAYATDISADVAAVELPPGVGTDASYFAAVVGATSHPESARQFVDFLSSDRARAVFRTHGFAP